MLVEKLVSNDVVLEAALRSVPAIVVPVRKTPEGSRGVGTPDAAPPICTKLWMILGNHVGAKTSKA